jgi:hypothetical protein
MAPPGAICGWRNALEVEVPTHVDPTKYTKTDENYLVVSRETFTSLDVALATLHERGIDTNDFDAIWNTQNPF